MTEKSALSGVEKIKVASDGLRGTIVEGLQDEMTNAISDDDQNLIKFHGMYQQDDRDRREERSVKKLERLYSFMIRLRLPGGFLTPSQWLALHDIAGENSTGVIKITTRQTIQLHGLLKSKIKPTIEAFSKAHLDSIATCGDINRNVVCSAHPLQSPVHAQVFAYADKISNLLMPKTRAYYEIWLGEEKIIDKTEEEDPLYQNRYLPRKFKVAIVIPPNNDVDVLANDVGLIAIIEDQQLKGFNIAIGGGMSATHGNPEHYPRLGTVIGFADSEEKTLKMVYEIATVQRDYGNRNDRKKARLKYTLDKYGVAWFKEEVEKRAGFTLESARPFSFNKRGDYYGWQQNHQGNWYYTVFVENGRILDSEQVALKSALKEIAELKKANIRFTCNQNLILSDIDPKDKVLVEEVLIKYQIIEHTEQNSVFRKNAMACVALNTCPLALAEGQRYLPALISKIEPLLVEYDLNKEEIIMRMTGCPNGCARPFAAEIGLVGTAYGLYNLYLGGDRYGQRLNKLYKENLDEKAILDELKKLFSAFTKHKDGQESLGDFSMHYCFN
ncbi:MAG: assimilatory sulfite reductase (NADPH) hemoprotein subunit [Flavisolibacter sp.]